MPQAAGLYRQMAGIQESYGVYSPKEYKKRVFLAFAAWTLTSKELVFGAALRYCKARGKDLQDEIISRLRGFSEDTNYLAKFRVKPCAALMAMIYHRTANFTAADFRARIANYHKMTKALMEKGYFVPGWVHNDDRSFWLYPFTVANTLQFADFCNANGVYCAYKSSQIDQIPVPEFIKQRNSDYRGTPNCGWLIKNQVYLPVHCRIAPKTQDLVVKRTVDILDRYYDYIGQLGKQVPVAPLALARPKL